jgi:hypothetical protein
MWYYAANKPGNVEGVGGYCSKTGVTNQYSCLSKSRSLVIKSCSVEKEFSSCKV